MISLLPKRPPPRVERVRSLAPLLGAMLWMSPPPAYAENTPESDRLKVCLDADLTKPIRFNEPIETAWKAVRAICEGEIIAFERSMLELYKADPEVPHKFQLEEEEVRTLLNHEIEKALLDYIDARLKQYHHNSN